MALKILARFYSDRWQYGDIQIVREGEPVPVWGPFTADGKSDNDAAAAHDNPTRDPAKAFGDTPCGEFTGTLIYVNDTPPHRRSYGQPNHTGQIPVIALEPLPGDTQAWKRQETEEEDCGHYVDMGLRIHAGDLNGLNHLRPTHGCVRVFQNHMTEILGVLLAGEDRQWPVSIQEKADIATAKIPT